MAVNSDATTSATGSQAQTVVHTNGHLFNGWLYPTNGKLQALKKPAYSVQYPGAEACNNCPLANTGQVIALYDKDAVYLGDLNVVLGYRSACFTMPRLIYWVQHFDGVITNTETLASIPFDYTIDTTSQPNDERVAPQEAAWDKGVLESLVANIDDSTLNSGLQNVDKVPLSARCRVL
ncbi:hypothetical protein LTR10_002412 [Elasticomyces elasticus]|uniref:Uncharacterized protein n=1 Tax=Elasticomyces elasticus TaxID=574655 RepID=A0AAN7VXW4_9PEZI|nr:hypothetical protein LTR10_002412 [Elasticomyces elasticus]KAK4973521.1 hypothetical protein LTR42_005510 [Elasticomyces elasticus]KAK5707634.1 hypothetical protein LTR97_000172 [Elasticomyces elasticus]